MIGVVEYLWEPEPEYYLLRIYSLSLRSDEVEKSTLTSDTLLMFLDMMHCITMSLDGDEDVFSFAVLHYEVYEGGREVNIGMQHRNADLILAKFDLLPSTG